jgi:lysozyme
MKLRHANQTARCLVGRAEGFSLEAYPDSGGIWTIGWGTTRIHRKPVTEGLTITKEQAVEYFNHDMFEVEAQVTSLVKVPLTNNQFSALVSLVYNIGSGQFQKSTLLRKLNQGDYDGAANEFERWVFDNGVKLDGLVTRRERERELFITPDDE